MAQLKDLIVAGDAQILGDLNANNFSGTDGTTAGKAGLVPAPATSDNNKYLKSNGTWDEINLNGLETNTNKVTSISSSSTDTQYPSAKLLYDQLQLKTNKAGDTMTGNLTISSGGLSVTSGYIYGEGSSNTNHAVKLGHNNDDIVKFFEYGGIFEFYKSQSGTNTLLGTINSNGWDGKLGYITSTTTDPGAGSALDTGRIIMVYE